MQASNAVNPNGNGNFHQLIAQNINTARTLMSKTPRPSEPHLFSNLTSRSNNGHVTESQLKNRHQVDTESNRSGLRQPTPLKNISVTQQSRNAEARRKSATGLNKHSKTMAGSVSHRSLNAPLQNNLSSRAKSGAKKLSHHNAHTAKKNQSHTQAPLTERHAINNST